MPELTFREPNPDATLGYTGHVVSPDHPLPVTPVDTGGLPVTAIGGGGGVVGLNGVTGIWMGTQAEYDGLTPADGVIYHIVGE